MTKRIVVVGGGLAGLTAAIAAANQGAEAVLLEARSEVGGRARTHNVDGYLLNQGPHALYAGLAGARVLRELGVTPRGKRPPASGAYGQLHGKVGRLPGTPADAIRSRLVGIRAKTQLGALLARPSKPLRTEMSGRSMRQWIDEQLTDPDARAIVTMTARVATYIDDLSTVAAEAAVPQLVAALADGVLYLDGGWQQLVDGLREVAVRVGVKIDRDTKIESIKEVADADALIVAAGSPTAAARIVGDSSSLVQRWAAEAEPVYATSLDLGLRRLPNPKRRVFFGVDDPIYLSVHTPSAALAPPEGGEVLHLMRYGDPADDPRAELEAFIDLAQPGWRDHVGAVRYGRRLVVSHSRPTPSAGFAGRPGPTIEDCDNVYVAGDWVGPEGMLADASLASGYEAARLAVR